MATIGDAPINGHTGGHVNGSVDAPLESAFSFKPTTLKDFEAVFPSLVEDLMGTCKSYQTPANALKWFENVSQATASLFGIRILSVLVRISCSNTPRRSYAKYPMP